MNLGEQLNEYKQQGMSFKQLIQVGKAISQDLPLDNIADVNLSPKEMKAEIEKELAKKSAQSK